MAQRITFEKLTADGKGLAYWQDKALFAEGPLPGEVAWVRVDRHHPKYVEAGVKRFGERSPHRTGTPEAHYLSCAPWQDVDYGFQLKLKRGMLVDAFARSGVEVGSVEGAPAATGYRNKLEFGVKRDAAGQLSLAMHERGNHDASVLTPDGCRLGSAGLNAAATGLVPSLQALPGEPLIESVMVRSSHATGQLVAVIYVPQGTDSDWTKLTGTGLDGLAVVERVDHLEQHVLWSRGSLELTERVAGLSLVYPWDAFFQVNPPAFEGALRRIVDAVPPGAQVLDLYGGVGTIGLAVAAKALSVTGLEVRTSAARLANVNARANGITNYEAQARPAETLDASLLAAADTVIVDPPRAGLAAKLVHQLVDAGPRQLIYLSCNPITQARDVAKLSAAYQAGVVEGFDFYPGTLHLESLVVLTRRG